MIPFTFSGSEITKVKLNNVQVIFAFVHVKKIYWAFINYIYSLHGIIFSLFRLTLVKISPSLLVSKVSIDLQEKNQKTFADISKLANISKKRFANKK